MQKRIIRNNTVSRVMTCLLTIGVCMLAFARFLRSTMHRQSLSQTRLLADILESSPRDEIPRTLSDLDPGVEGRITFVDSSGKVIFDSEYPPRDMGNHSGRREIAAALREGSGRARRYSDTEKKTVYYSAVKVGDQGVVRLGITTAGFAGDFFYKVTPFVLLGAGCIMAFVLFISGKTTKRIVKTIENYDIETGQGEIYPELSDFVDKIKSQNDIINRQLESLNREKMKFQNIFMNIKEGIMVCGSGGDIVRANREAAKIFSLPELPRDFARCVDIPRISRLLPRAVSGETSHCTFEWKEGHYQRTVSPNPGSRTEDNTGENGAVIVITDITRQVESEEDRRIFTDNVTHELKTPLTNILGYSQLIANGMAKDEDVRKFAGVVESNANNLLDMINDIIKISNLESGYGFEKELIPLDEVLLDAVRSETTPARARGIDIETKAEKVDIMADEGRMYQLVHNLVSNAVKYNIPGGKVRIDLKKQGDSAILTVRDTGIGISPRDKERIFERFYVVDKSRNKNTSSTGLGLSIVKHVVKAHGGTVSVDSKPGEGSTFTVRLPLGIPPEQ